MNASIQSNVRTRLRTFILDNYLFSDDETELANEQSFLETGVLDSTGILEVVMFIEESFDVAVKDSEMMPENLDSVNAVVAYVGRKAARSV